MNRLALTILQLTLCIGVPALLACFVPRRWRLWAVVAWVLSPLLIALLIAASEIASGRASAAELDKLVYGLLLVGSILALPWLLACACGYAIGAALRNRFRSGTKRQEPTLQTPVSAPPSQPDPLPYSQPEPRESVHSAAGPSLDPPSGWQAAHVGFAHDDLILDGLAIWSLEWQPEKQERVWLPHPAHPAEQHEFTIYNVHDGKRATRFAATELSNGVWGFYRWLVPADASAGKSADGSLRFEHELAPPLNGHFDAAAPFARLLDVRSGEVLFDGSHWASSRVVPQTDGTLLLALDHAGRQTIFRIDPVAGTFVDLSLSHIARPLASLRGAAATARAECDDPVKGRIRQRVAPDGSLKVELEPTEWGNTHWVHSPRIVELATGRVLLDLWGTDWDATIHFPRVRTVRLNMRRYHVGGALDAEISLDDQRYFLQARAHSSSGPLHELAQALERVSRELASEAGSRPMIEAPPVAMRSWVVALLIAAGAFAAIAAATVITLRMQDEAARQKLDTVPDFKEGP